MAHVWAIANDAFVHLQALATKAEGPLPESASKPVGRKGGKVAVLPLYGVLEPRLSFAGWLFGGTSTAAFGEAFQNALSDDSIGKILIDVDSPGGRVTGTMELGDMIHASRGVKPIIAVANHQADSAAYWIASAADKLYVSPSGRVGSVGTIVTHQDWSERYKQAGIKEYVVVSDDSPYKGEWLESQPANEEYLAELKRMANEAQSVFTTGVARNRGVSTADVRSRFGKGRDVSAKYAVENGMADGIATFGQVLRKMMDGRERISRKDKTPSARAARLQELKNCS